MDSHYLRTSVELQAVLRAGGGAGISVWAEAQKHQRHWQVLLYLPAALHISPWLSPDFSTFLHICQTNFQLQIFATCYSISISPLRPPQITRPSISSSAYIISTSRLISSLTLPPLTISSLLDTCWVSLHCGIKYFSLYNPMCFFWSIICSILRVAKATFTVALLLNMLYFLSQRVGVQKIFFIWLVVIMKTM